MYDNSNFKNKKTLYINQLFIYFSTGYVKKERYPGIKGNYKEKDNFTLLINMQFLNLVENVLLKCMTIH